jgi:hypothetical protein
MSKYSVIAKFLRNFCRRRWAAILKFSDPQFKFAQFWSVAVVVVVPLVAECFALSRRGGRAPGPYRNSMRVILPVAKV